MTTWAYRDDVGTRPRSLTGYNVEAADGHIGKIDEASAEAGAAYVVVDTGFWIFGKKRLIPASVVERIDDKSRTVYVGMTKGQIKDAPDFDERHRDLTPYDKYYSAY